MIASKKIWTLGLKTFVLLSLLALVIEILAWPVISEIVEQHLCEFKLEASCQDKEHIGLGQGQEQVMQVFWLFQIPGVALVLVFGTFAVMWVGHWYEQKLESQNANLKQEIDVRESVEQSLLKRTNAIEQINNLLTQANQRMVALRQFSHTISSWDDPTKILLLAFQDLCQHLGAIHQGVLFQDDQVLTTNGLVAEDLMEKLFGSTLWEQLQNGTIKTVPSPSKKSEIVICNSTQLDHPLCRFQEKIKPTEIHHCHMVVVQFLTWNYTLYLHREPDGVPFDDADTEYIQTMIDQIYRSRVTIQKVTVKNELLPELLTIEKHLEDLVYIMSQEHYCVLRLSSKKEDITLRISLKVIQNYFDDSILRRVHRSYLVNPNHIQSIQRKKTSHYNDYEISFKSSSNPVPVGRSSIPQLRKTFPDFFQS